MPTKTKPARVKNTELLDAAISIAWDRLRAAIGKRTKDPAAQRQQMLGLLRIDLAIVEAEDAL